MNIVNDKPVDELVNGIVVAGMAKQRGVQQLKTIDPAKLDELEKAMFELVESGVLKEISPVTTHTFTPNTYVREGKMFAGSVYLGHSHKTIHHCIVISGRMSLLNADRTTTEIVAPCVFLGSPGRKAVFIHEDVIMQNIHDTRDLPREVLCEERIEELEDLLYSKTDAYREHQRKLLK